MNTKRLLIAASLLGCGQSGSAGSDTALTATESGSTASDSSSPDDGTGEDDDGADAETGQPDPDGEGPSGFPLGRRVRRMTADQYARSLRVATGQDWPQYEEFAPALGRADFAEIVAHDRTLSVTFDKFIHDAALFTCRAAIDQDIETGAEVILRHVTLADAGEADLRANVAYLMLRFLAVDVGPNDERVDPWLEILTAPSELADPEEEIRRERWTAVCVGFATHVDFVTY